MGWQERIDEYKKEAIDYYHVRKETFKFEEGTKFWKKYHHKHKDIYLFTRAYRKFSLKILMDYAMLLDFDVDLISISEIFYKDILISALNHIIFEKNKQIKSGKIRIEDANTQKVDLDISKIKDEIAIMSQRQLINEWSSSSWNEEEHNILKQTFQEGKSYEEIAEEINRYRTEKSFAQKILLRSPRAVVFQAAKMGLMTQEELLKWDNQRELSIKKQRQQDYFEIKKKVFERDKHRCVICGSEKPEFAHIIPFDKSRVNKEDEAISLCYRHHKIFDGYKLNIENETLLNNEKNKITEIIFHKMCSYYPLFSENYEFYSTYCANCGSYHSGIIKRE